MWWKNSSPSSVPAQQHSRLGARTPPTAKTVRLLVEHAKVVPSTDSTSEADDGLRWDAHRNHLFGVGTDLEDGSQASASQEPGDKRGLSSLPEGIRHQENPVDSRGAVVVSLYRTTLQRLIAVLLAFGLIGMWGVFWIWWGYRVHGNRVWPVLDILLSVSLLWETVNGVYAQMIMLRAGMVSSLFAEDPPRFRIAMVVTKAPSEPEEVVQKTLLGMLKQDYPYAYDVWLADEKLSPTMKLWCFEHAVRVSTREGVEAYHRANWPKRTKCKEGNLAYFYDTYGYDNYDLVAQFDCDHVPTANYLSSCVAVFNDPDIGYAAFPSICSSNRRESFGARGRLYQDAQFQGIYQASLSKTWMPCAIGSHYMVRTAHLKKAGGIGPELDEDFSTSYIMTACGFKGAFSINTIAIGDGPLTFEDAMRQEYQWARSMMVLFMQYIPMWWRSKELHWRERFRVMHVILYYWATALVPFGLVLWMVVPAVGVAYGPFNLLDFLLHVLPIFAIHYLAFFFYWCNGWLRPVNIPLLSWEGPLHRFCYHFWVLEGVLHGVLDGLLKRPFVFLVTPKGKVKQGFLRARTLLPLLLMTCISAGCIVFGKLSIHLTMILGALHLLAAIIIPIAHLMEHKGNTQVSVRSAFFVIVMVAAAAGFLGYAVYRRADEIRVGFSASFDFVYNNPGYKAWHYVI